jgi:anti-sigma regulatory factor (Ser/Thr protein kinase)
MSPVSDPRRSQVALAASSTSVGQARRFLREALRSWDAGGFEWAATQALSELVTNAVLHADTPLTVSFALSDSQLRIEVADGSARLPRQRRYGREATTGRGIALVAGLSRAWGVEATSGGKLVWCELVAAADDDVEPDLDAFFTVDELAELWQADRGSANVPSADARTRVDASHGVAVAA